MIIFSTICGMILGALAGGLMWLAQCTCAFVNCEEATSFEELKPVFILFVGIGGIIGLVVGIVKYLEEKAVWEEEEAKERLRQELLLKAEADERYNIWNNNLEYELENIQNSIFSDDFYNQGIYKTVFELYEYGKNVGEKRYIIRYEQLTKMHINYLEMQIIEAFKKPRGIIGVGVAVNAVECIRSFMHNEEAMKVVGKRINDFLSYVYKPVHYLNIDEYGNCELPIFSQEEMKYIDDNLNYISNSIDEKIKGCSENNNHSFDGIAKNLDACIVYDASRIMWYYAKKKPFDANKFQQAQMLYDSYTAYDINRDDYKQTIAVESLLAQIYAKNQIGGEGVVQQDKKLIDEWVEMYIESGFEFTDKCIILIYGLEWMELYNIEKEILRKLVAKGISLPEHLEERLGFLESGGLTNVKVYDNENITDFVYDSSSIDWGIKEFDMFFRQIAMKKINLNYSLAITKWNKTLPLQSGQKVDVNKIYQDFEQMLEDFDNEVCCKIENVRAINLQNVIFENAMVFYFNSKRNKCISVVFSCEKYGRNLNISIMTMFTPENNISLDELKNYAVAIKENIYMESFRESILQVVDEALKQKKSVYDFQEENVMKKVFE